MIPVLAGSQRDRRKGGPAGRRLLFATILFFLFLPPFNRGSSQEIPNPIMKSGGVGVGIALASTVLPTALGTWLLWEDSGSTTALGGLLLAYGWVVGPLPGNVYAGDKKRGLVGMGIRVGSLLLPALAIAGAGGAWDEDGSSGTEGLILLGIGAGLATTAWNIGTIPGSVRRHNESLMLSPVVRADRTFGVRVDLRW